MSKHQKSAKRAQRFEKVRFKEKVKFLFRETSRTITYRRTSQVKEAAEAYMRHLVEKGGGPDFPEGFSKGFGKARRRVSEAVTDANPHLAKRRHKDERESVIDFETAMAAARAGVVPKLAAAHMEIQSTHSWYDVPKRLLRKDPKVRAKNQPQ